jgi:hypothetical protein
MSNAQPKWFVKGRRVPLYAEIVLPAALLAMTPVSAIGWVERSDTHPAGG